MENATKALMIAAAVIVAILIISLVMGIFNTGAEQVENANLDEYAIQQHNEKFTKYEGDKESGSEVNALLTTVFTHNNAQDETNTCVKVKAEAGVYGSTQTEEKEVITLSNAIETSPDKVPVAAKYEVELKYSTVTKLVNEIIISPAT